MKTAVGLLSLCFAVSAIAAGPDQDKLAAGRNKAIEYLKTSQAEDGSWTSPEAGGISALCTYALLESGVSKDDPVVAKALARIEKSAQPDGSICPPNARIAAYETAIAVLALTAADKDKYSATVQNAEKFLRTSQIDESRGAKPEDVNFGGVSYGPKSTRADLSNTAFFLEALEAAGVKCEDPAMKNAVTFISRCQNLESEYNTSPAAAKINDGGFFYTPSGGGASPAGKTNEGGLRSYGSMTYAGFKSMLTAGLTKDDPRVKAALEWIRKNYAINENPGMGANGLYYYYYLFARALKADGIETLEDDKGGKHDWRKELAEAVLSQQKGNGSWVNKESDKWMEGDPNLVTAYALVVLKNCEAK
jgi:squalene-hopene/tetraprenyl-beta-curcumene cyclase